MGDFTPVESWSKGGQDLSGANEIVTSYIEHRKILGQSTTGINLLTGGVGGDNAQDRTIWIEMQDWLETYCVFFLDTENGPLKGDKTDFIYFSKASWQAAAGLNVSTKSGGSFRRKSIMSNPFDYDYILPADIRGYWCFEDLQKGFSMLKATRWNTVWEPDGEKRSGDAAHSTDCNQARLDQSTAWSGATWKSDSGASVYRAYGRKGFNDYGHYAFSAVREHKKIWIRMGASEFGAMCDVYYRANYNLAHTFLDMDGVGVNDGEYVKVASGASVVAGGDTLLDSPATLLGLNEDANPVALSGLGCPITGEQVYEIYFTSPSFTVAYWDFTYN